jgi:hypothetical protein
MNTKKQFYIMIGFYIATQVFLAINRILYYRAEQSGDYIVLSMQNSILNLIISFVGIYTIGIIVLMAKYHYDSTIRTVNLLFIGTMILQLIYGFYLIIMIQVDTSNFVDFYSGNIQYFVILGNLVSVGFITALLLIAKSKQLFQTNIEFWIPVLTIIYIVTGWINLLFTFVAYKLDLGIDRANIVYFGQGISYLFTGPATLVLIAMWGIYFYQSWNKDKEQEPTEQEPIFGEG